jgi:hypothetical protein
VKKLFHNRVYKYETAQAREKFQYGLEKRYGCTTSIARNYRISRKKIVIKKLLFTINKRVTGECSLLYEVCGGFGKMSP